MMSAILVCAGLEHEMENSEDTDCVLLVRLIDQARDMRMVEGLRWVGRPCTGTHEGGARAGADARC
jgi:hypothetical protein